MEKLSSIKLQLIASICMFIISVFMSISYYIKISNSEADRLTVIAFYVWIFSIFAWLIKLVHDIRVFRKSRTGQEKS
jgi:Ni,Fe-hydrogenase I cytochrome b subunit